MRTTLNNPALSAPAGTATSKFKLATINAAGDADLCGATTQPIGQTMDDVDAGDLQGLRLFTAGTLVLVASAAIARLAPVYAAASGKISSTLVDGGFLIGIALEAAGADGDEIEVLPQALAALVPQTIAAVTAVAPNAGALNSGDAGTDTVIGSIRTQVNALITDLTAIRTAAISSKLFG